ncbi:MAG: NUDIX domain-containing protein [Candidatus Falkowbacteria bacterium]
MSELLNIVDDNDEIIGEVSREEIHRLGLRHREIHVYFVTPSRELILQHRAKNKDTYPDLLDATVGGHVEIGHSYEDTVLKECEEETGIKLELSDLIFIDKIKRESKDITTGKNNKVYGCRYLYIYRGDLKDLKIEEGKALGFELWPIESLLTLSEEEKSRFIPYILEVARTELLNIVSKLKF